MRVLRLLKEVAWIAAEDTRHTRNLLRHYGIDTHLTSLHQHNEKTKSAQLVQRLVRGESGALVSDAGTPLLSDPGFTLVTAAVEAGVRVVPVPGASALLAALVGSALPPHPFYFGGFVPRHEAKARATLEALSPLEATLLFYEVPHRLRATLAMVAEIFPTRRIVVARELTKVHEEFVRGSAEELVKHFDQEAPRGECVLLIEGAVPDEAKSRRIDDEAIALALQETMATGKSKKEAIQDVASFLGVGRNRVYRVAIAISDRKEGEPPSQTSR